MTTILFYKLAATGTKPEPQPDPLWRTHLMLSLSAGGSVTLTVQEAWLEALEHSHQQLIPGTPDGFRMHLVKHPGSRAKYSRLPNCQAAGVIRAVTGCRYYQLTHEHV